MRPAECNLRAIKCNNTIKGRTDFEGMMMVDDDGEKMVEV
jgi:hypothetical protein